MSARNMGSIKKDIERCKERLAKDRDALRELIAEAQDIEECASDAIDQLEYAADRLSEVL